MTAAPHVVVLAAGEARRFGSPKQLALVDGVPLVRRAALAALAFSDDVTVVTGAHREAVERALDGLGVFLAHNPDWSEGMGGSIACAFRQLPAGAAAAIILLADQPCVGAPQLQRLVVAQRGDPQRIVIADHGETCGPPCLFPGAYHAELAALAGPQGARTVIERHRDRVAVVLMPEAAVDIDTVEDYRRFAGPA